MTTPQRKFRHLPILLATLAIGLGVFSFAKSNNQQSIQETQATYTQSVNDYYEGFNWNLTGASLKTALFNKIKITTAGWDYGELYDAYRIMDVRPDGTHLWDIYSDSTDYTLNDKRINASYKKEGDSLNREHVIPQSSFNEAAPMKSDIHHVLPSDGYVNNRRGSYPHGNVTGSVTYTSNDGCKLGSGGGNLGTVFEPMPQYKGDIARIYFYFVTCYENKMSSNSFSAFNKTTYPSIDSKYLSTYLQWAKDDPVSQKEIDRNNAAYAGQGNRNPFVDCPYAIGAIWDSDHATDYGVKGQYTSGTGISLSKTTVSLISGGTTTINATSSEGTSISWTTSNSGVVSLSSNSSNSGSNITLTAGNAGTATVTATTTINSKSYSKTCSVTVNSTKQVSSITISGQTTSFTVGDTFSFGGTVTASYNDGTTANVTSSSNFSGYNMSSAGTQTVTVSYSYGGVTKTASYQISVYSSGGSTDISDYTIASSPLTSDGISDGMKVLWGTSTSNLATSIDNNWIYLSTDSEDWIIFTLEGSSSGFTLKYGTQYVYSSGDKKVSFSNSSTTFTFNSNNVVYNSNCGSFTFNSTGIRPYTSSTGSNAYLYALTENKTLLSIDIDTFPTKTEYEVGEYFNPNGLVITRNYTDGTHDTYSYSGHTSEFTFIPSLSTKLTIEDETIEIIYDTKSCFFEIELDYPLILESITVSGYTTSFSEGDTFSFGGTVTGHYENGEDENVTSEASFSGYDMTVLGNQTVTVTVGEKTVSYSINIGAGTLSSIAVSGQTTNYVKNATFSFNGICTATFANGYQKQVTPTNVSSPQMSTVGSKTITVSFTYNGSTKSTTYSITVIGRTVTESSTTTANASITWPSSATPSIIGTFSDLSAVLSDKTQYEDQSIRLGTGSGGGTLTISCSNIITNVQVSAKYYSSNQNSYSNSILKVDGSSVGSLTSSYKTYSKTISPGKSTITIVTDSSSSRVNIQSVTLTGTKTTITDITSTSDCVGLESFVDTYMHMDYTQNLGYCKDSTHHYYSSAKSAFNNLNTHQRSLFTSNSAYANEWERLSTWAEKNGDALNNNNLLAQASNYQKFAGIPEKNNTLIILISIISMVGIASIGTCLYIQKHKKND